MYPLDPTSNGIKLHVYPWSSISCLSAVYFRVFLAFALSIFLSKLHVNSRTNTFLVSLFNSTKSGLDVVTRMSGGIVLPFRSSPGRSANTSIFSGLFAMIVFVFVFSVQLL